MTEDQSDGVPRTVVEPKPVHDFYTDRAWTPPGPRLHVLLLPALAAQLAQTYHPVLQRWSHVLRLVPAHRMHITLAWVDRPTAAQISPAERTAVQAAITRALTASMPLAKYAAINLELASLERYGVRCDVRDYPKPIVELGLTLTAALQSVFPAGHVVGPSTDPSKRPHLALAYGTAETDLVDLRDPLADAPPPAWPHPATPPLGACRLLITDADTFNTTSWDWTNTTDLTPTFRTTLGRDDL